MVVSRLVGFDFCARARIFLASEEPMPPKRKRQAGRSQLSARWRPFTEARELVWTLGLRDAKEWQLYCRGRLPHKGERPDDIPPSPDVVYHSKGWNSWADWFGTATPVEADGRLCLPFPSAREYVRALGLTGEAEWALHCRMALSGSRPALPAGMPLAPEKVYQGFGWQGWQDWLIAAGESRRGRQFRSYAQARRFARSLSLRSSGEWKKYCRGGLPGREPLPSDIPATPEKVYKGDGWMSWGDWLGTGPEAFRKRRVRPFREARRFVRGLGLKSIREWLLYCRGRMKHLGRRPDGIPRRPHEAYKAEGWVNWGDWLGTGTVASFLREFRPFADAREFARRLGLKGENEWRRYCRGELPHLPVLPGDIPREPSRTYRQSGWVSWGDWLGTGTVASQLRVYRPFDEARQFVRALGLRNLDEWRQYCKGERPTRAPKPDDIPHAANDVYEHQGWVSWGDWFGTNSLGPGTRHYRPFEQAREFARALRLATQAQWKAFCRGRLQSKGSLPQDIPRAPRETYACTGWISMGDWLGTGKPPRRTGISRDFEAARTFVRALGIRNQTEWQQYCRGGLPHLPALPADIPRHPCRVYAGKGWVSWGDWFGTGYVANQARQYRRFEPAREFVRSLKLKSRAEWQSYCRGDMPSKGRLPADVPSNPQLVYGRKGWTSWGDWLGTGTVCARLRGLRAFDEARTFVRNLKLRSRTEWQAYCRGEMPSKARRPADIPANPARSYRNMGWKGVRDWLGPAGQT
ncbi:MAG: hypothetical protein A3K19_23925 [Lentisphaerae bacterium RIFOXYB12_FULL_65_16]|nr:MAG: hypothetical protein A3K19_23925 [Lentisphaerae bacterium RIFOXYB12_FULL_65_16]